MLTSADLSYILQLPDVAEARSKLDQIQTGKIYFTITLTDSIRSALVSRFDIDLTNVQSVPMRWIKGDTAPHVDVGPAKFEFTHMVYVTDSAGSLVIDGTEYPIQENTGYVFEEGRSHATYNTGSVPRLLIGPMSNQAFAVGGIRHPCFLEGTQILCLINGAEVYIPVESLKKGMLVKTSRDGFKAVDIIGSGSIQNPGTTDRYEHRLYKCSPSKYPELTSDLYLTGCHSILVDELTEKQRAETKRILVRIFVTDKKYRLAASIDERAEPWASEGVYTIWHFALENTDDNMNYGVYANGGLLVESCCKSTMRMRSNFSCT